MRSLRSHFFLFLLKNRHWFNGRLHREVIDFDTSIEAQREGVERGAERFGKLPESIQVRSADVTDPAAEWIEPAEATAGTILYFHGGGYVMGSARSHRAIVAKFVQRTGLRALVFDYRLAPEHPFPAALEDALSAYKWLLSEETSAERIVFAGDSAGAGLVLATLLAVRDRGLPLPAGAAALSPWTDLVGTGDSYQMRDPLAPDGSFEVYSHYYAGDHDKTDPLVSPLYGELSGLPPLFLSAGEREVMRDDAVQFADKAATAGVDVTLRVGTGMVHCYPVLSPLFPEATAALDEICEFLSRHCPRLSDGPARLAIDGAGREPR